MIRVRISRVERTGHEGGLDFYSYEQETKFLSLYISDDNKIQVTFHFWTIWNKEELVDNYSLLLILMKKALKVFKKDYPERYEIVRLNLETYKSRIL